MEHCHHYRRPLRIDPETSEARCVCGARGQRLGEPSSSGSYFYVCSRSGAPLGYVGI